MPLLDVVIRTLLAAALGGLIGIEREIREHTAGFRTHILVSVGAAAFTMASAYGFGPIPSGDSRIAAGIVSGIGFLGAGAIIRHGVSVRGLTTAASLWAVAAVGLAAGQGFYNLAIITTVIVVVSLYALRLIEARFLYSHVGGEVAVRVRFRDEGYQPLTVLMGALDQARVSVRDMSVTTADNGRDTIHLLLRLPRGMTVARVTALIGEVESVRSVEVEHAAAGTQLN